LDYNGLLHLARLNLNEQQEIAEAFKITNVPTILAVIKGKMFFNRLVGIPTDVSLKKFVTALLSHTFGSELDKILSDADALLDKNDIAGAAQLFNRLLTVKKYSFAEVFGLAGLVQCAIKEGNLETAQDLVKTIQSRYQEYLNESRIKQAISQVELQSMEGNSKVDVQGLLDKIKQNPKDSQSLYDLGVHYQRIGRYQEAMNQMFQIIKNDREWNDQAAKQMLLKIFDSLGPEHDLSVKGRKRLSNVWFV